MKPVSVRCDDDLLPGAQMALDETLLDAGVHAPLLRFYRWTPPAISCGRGQDPARVADSAELSLRGWGLVRRPTGGGALLHRGDLTFSLLLPRPAAGTPRRACEAVRRIVSWTLGRLSGAPTVPPGGGHATGNAPVCFLGGHPGEVYSPGGKTAGVALRWKRHGCLVQVSLLLEDNADDAAACLLPPEGMTREEFAERLRRSSVPLASLVSPLPSEGEIRAVIAEETASILG